MHERLEDPDDEADFARRPIGELVARICQDLGVTPDWSLWEAEDWALGEAEAKLPGSPYARPGAVRRMLTPPWEKPVGGPPPPRLRWAGMGRGRDVRASTRQVGAAQHDDLFLTSPTSSP